MRRVAALLIPALLLLGGRAEARRLYTNPILHLDYSDPDVCRVGDDYWMTASSFNCFPGLPILHSKDLVNWELVGAALTDYPGPLWDGDDASFREGVSHGSGVWAPAIRYHDGWFYIFCGDPDRGIFMVRTQDPTGSWEPPVWLVREKGFIDPCPFWNEDGSAWLSHGCAGSRAGLKSVLFMAPMAPDGSRLLAPSRIIYDGHLTQPTIEGTKMYRRGDWYYIFSPAGGVATGWQTVLRASDPYGPYEERIVMAWAPGTINGPHQGAWVDTPSGEDWFIHFQDKGAYGRIVHLQPLRWGPDGWPVIGEDPDGDGCGQPVSSFTAPDLPAYYTSSAAAPGPYGISLDWQYPAIPSPYWHMALPGGAVRLYSVQQQEPGLWNCRNLLLRKFAAESFSVSARMDFRPNPQLRERGENCGFLVMGDDYAGLRLTDTPEGARLGYFVCEKAPKGGVESETEVCTIPYSFLNVEHSRESGSVPKVAYPDVPAVSLWVRLEVEPWAAEGNVPDAVCRFSYSLDGRSWTPVPGSFRARPETWIGAKWGIFCNRTAPKNDSGWCDVTVL